MRNFFSKFKSNKNKQETDPNQPDRKDSARTQPSKSGKGKQNWQKDADPNNNQMNMNNK